MSAIPVNARNSAHFRDIIWDRVRISIGKRAGKKSSFEYRPKKSTKCAGWSAAEGPHQIGLCPRRVNIPSFGAGPPTKSTKRAGTSAQKTEILKNSYSCPYKHLRSSKLQKSPNFRTKRAGCSKGREADFVGWGLSPRHFS